MFPRKRVVLSLGVALAFALTALPCEASLHDGDEISEEDSRKLAEVLAGAPKLDFPAEDSKPVDEAQACKPPLMGDANPKAGNCDPMLSAKPKVEKVREAKREPVPAADKSASPKNL